MIENKDWIEKLHKVTKIITNKTIIQEENSELYQDDKVIKVPSGEGNLLLTIHEIGHYLAATPEEKKMDNLGLTDELTDLSIEREIQSREISHFLFNQWIKSEIPKEYRHYGEYITKDIFSGNNGIEITDDWIMNKIETEKIDINKIWNILY